MVERAGLENRNTRKRIVGSNPTLSAKKRLKSQRKEHFTKLAIESLLWGWRHVSSDGTAFDAPDRFRVRSLVVPVHMPEVLAQAAAPRSIEDVLKVLEHYKPDPSGAAVVRRHDRAASQHHRSHRSFKFYSSGLGQHKDRPGEAATRGSQTRSQMQTGDSRSDRDDDCSQAAEGRRWLIRNLHSNIQGSGIALSARPARHPGHSRTLFCSTR